ncbi:MAG: hypothetical protein MZV70_67565 [Desulfobacterales bacterium]|nr:hypothetical protein [Desulfobacterales bacterium]
MDGRTSSEVGEPPCGADGGTEGGQAPGHGGHVPPPGRSDHPDDQAHQGAETDVKGRIIRAGKPRTCIWPSRSWGAGPSFMTGAEVYLGLQRNTINGAINSLASYMEQEALRSGPARLDDARLSTVHTFIAMNKGFFEKLTPDQQKIITGGQRNDRKQHRSIRQKTLKETWRRQEEGKGPYPHGSGGCCGKGMVPSGKRSQGQAEVAMP